MNIRLVACFTAALATFGCSALPRVTVTPEWKNVCDERKDQAFVVCKEHTMLHFAMTVEVPFNPVEAAPVDNTPVSNKPTGAVKGSMYIDIETGKWSVFDGYMWLDCTEPVCRAVSKRLKP